MKEAPKDPVVSDGDEAELEWQPAGDGYDFDYGNGYEEEEQMGPRGYAIFDEEPPADQGGSSRYRSHNCPCLGGVELRLRFL